MRERRHFHSIIGLIPSEVFVRYSKLVIKLSPQGPRKLSSIKSLKIQPLPLKTRKCAMKLSEMASLSNSNRKERPNQSKNNGDTKKKAKRL